MNITQDSSGKVMRMSGGIVVHRIDSVTPTHARDLLPFVPIDVRAHHATDARDCP